MPASLRRNADCWCRELMAAVTAPNPDRSLINKCSSRYNKPDVRAALEEMYGGLCCYCEAGIGIVSFSHIEHRCPKSVHPERTFDWDNLHLACQVCNTSKGDKWNDDCQILDSVHDTISEHLTYKFAGEKRWSKSHRGTITIEYAALNRQKLRDARTKIAHEVLDTICSLNCDPGSPTAGLLRAELEEKTSGEYGSLINWLLTSYARDPGTPDP